ncbi:MAG: choice-of-anchor D domain-containing protein [Ignavibacteriales bacterium]|nr:choice-of-anchor D domain-containing protein [Ignavibacteriales bacterium]
MRHITIISFVLLCINVSLSFAQSTTVIQQQTTTPLEKLLNPDGTINTKSGFSGTLDPEGYHMVIDPKGTPQFIQTTESAAVVPADSSWDDKFVYSGTEWLPVRAIAVSGTDVYIGGDFNYIHNIQAKRIAKWNGSSWSALGLGLRGGAGNWGMVNAIAVNGSDLYVVGGFDTAGTVLVKNVAKWNGTNWTALGSGIPSAAPTAIATNGVDVYVGGPFTSAGGVSANNIAKWNGSSWSALGTGISGGWYGTTTINIIAVSGSNMYVGGVFGTCGGVATKNIARWDGSNWFALGSDTIRAAYGGYSFVKAIALSGTDVYVGGQFDSIGTLITTNIAKWDGSTWSALGTGANSSITAIAVNGTDVYAGGNFNNVGGVSANQLARWDGANWYAMGTGLNSYGNIYALVASGSDIFIGGDFSKVGGELTKCVAKWNGSHWSSIPSGLWLGLNGSVQSLAGKDNDLYFGGLFNNMTCINSIGKFNRTSVTDVSCGHSGGPIKAIAIVGETVYVGGTNMYMGGNYGFLRWDSYNGWGYYSDSRLMDGTVNAIAVIGNDIYAGGRFGWPNPVNNIARWNGTSWSALGSGISKVGGYEQVYSLAVIGSDLYVAGNFDHAGGIAVNGFAKWTGTTWSAVGSPSGPTDGYISVLAAAGNTLYVGGWFTSIGGVSANQIAKWNGTTWSALGTGLSRGSNESPKAIVFSGTDVYVGGKFTTAGGVSAKNIAKWDGSAWSALGSGVEGDVYALCVIGPDLYVGGDFLTAGGKTSLYWGRWKIPQGYFASSATTVQFDSVAVNGMKTDSITVDNNGHASLIIGSAISNNLEFGVFPPSGTIPASSNQKFYITFSPVSGGLKNGAIIFSHNGFSSHDTVKISGKGYILKSPQFLANPANIFFGTVSPGSTKQDSAFIKNTGDSVLTISSALSTDPEFTVNPTSATITPGDSMKFYFRFSPISLLYNFRIDTVIYYHNGVGLSSRIICTADNRFTSVVENGWNMSSVPVHASDYLKSSIYPTAVSPAFTYQGSYIMNDTLQSGIGYWVKFDSPQTVAYAGTPITNDTIEVIDKWNIIGSISTPVAVSNITSEPGGIVTSQFFSYTGTYLSSDNIMPGKAYWVKTNQAGKLILSNSGSALHANKIQIIHTDELPPPAPGESESSTLLKMPESFGLQQNYPNPFNPTTMIQFTLPEDAIVTLRVYNMLGQEVATLLNQEMMEAGTQDLDFDASNFPSGVYFYRLIANGVGDEDEEILGRMYTSVRKMILVK